MITSFRLPPEERELVRKITDRIQAEMTVDDVTSAEMDITACHKYGTPLDLAKLLSAPPASFAHDVSGISAYIDRNTGYLTGAFDPRCSLPESYTTFRIAAVDIAEALGGVTLGGLTYDVTKVALQALATYWNDHNDDCVIDAVHAEAAIRSVLFDLQLN